MFNKMKKKIQEKINPEGIKLGDTVELLKGFSTGKDTFTKGERLVVVCIGLTSIDLEDAINKRRWVTDVSFREVQKVV